MNNLMSNDRSAADRSRLPFQPSDIFGFDPFRNFFSSGASGPGLEINRTDDGYTVEVPVAGFGPEDVEVTLENGVLSISGKSEKRSFTRSLLLPDEIDGDNVQAHVEHGMLTLTLNLLPKAQPKKIAIKTS